MTPQATEHRRTRIPGKIDINTPPGGLPIVGAAVWLAARLETVFNNDDDVGTWTDMTGNGRNATQSTADYKPHYKTNIINGLPVMRFDGTDDSLSLGDLSGVFSAGATLFIVATPDDTGYSIYATHTQGDADIWWRYTSGNGYFGPFRTGRYEAWPTTMPSSGNHLWVVASSTGVGTYKVFLDNVSKGTQDATHSGGNAHVIGFPGAGYGRMFKGDIAEIIIYPSALSTDDIDTIEAYLNTLYAIY